MTKLGESFQAEMRLRRLRMAGAEEGQPASTRIAEDMAYIHVCLADYLVQFRGAARRSAPLAGQTDPLTRKELDALTAVGMSADALAPHDAELARREALFTFFHVFHAALHTPRVAAMLRSNPTQVLRRAREGTLLALRYAGELRFPAAQFYGHSEIPHLREVLLALPDCLAPLEVLSWFTLPTDELRDSKGSATSPRMHLISTKKPGPIVCLAQQLRFQ